MSFKSVIVFVWVFFFLDLHFVVEVPPVQHIPRGLHRSNDLAKVRMYPGHLELIKMKIV